MTAGMAVIAHLVVAFFHGGPVAVPDVPAYLGFSQWIYGGTLPESIPYHPAYGLLLSPVGWLPGADLHTAALVLNAALAGVVVVFACQLAVRMGASANVVSLIGVVAAIHPSVSSSSRIAWPETLITSLLLGLALLIHAQRNCWSLIGVSVAFAFAVHPRLVVIGVAALIVSVFNQQLKAFLIGVIPASVAASALLYVTNSWPSDRLTAAQSVESFWSVLVCSSGQWLATNGSTAGIASIGLLAVFVHPKISENSSAALFIALSGFAMLLLGGWVLAGSERIDTLAYNRYLGPWAIPLTVVGVTALFSNRVGIKTKIFSFVLSGSAAIAALTHVDLSDNYVRHIMTLGQTMFWSLFNDQLTGVVLSGLLVTGISLVLCGRFPLLPVALLILTAVPSTFLNHRHLSEVGEIAEGQVTTAALVPAHQNCLAHDSSVKSYVLYLYRLELPHMEHKRIHLGTDTKLCSTFVVAADDAQTRCPSLELIAAEPRGPWGLWRYPMAGCD